MSRKRKSHSTAKKGEKKSKARKSGGSSEFDSPFGGSDGGAGVEEDKQKKEVEEADNNDDDDVLDFEIPDEDKFSDEDFQDEDKLLKPLEKPLNPLKPLEKISEPLEKPLNNLKPLKLSEKSVKNVPKAAEKPLERPGDSRGRFQSLRGRLHRRSAPTISAQVPSVSPVPRPQQGFSSFPSRGRGYEHQIRGQCPPGPFRPFPPDLRPHSPSLGFLPYRGPPSASRFNLSNYPSTSVPSSSTSAGFPASTASAGFPLSSTSAGFPASSASAGFPAIPASAGFPLSSASAGFPLSSTSAGFPVGACSIGFPVNLTSAGFPARGCSGSPDPFQATEAPNQTQSDVDSKAIHFKPEKKSIFQRLTRRQQLSNVPSLSKKDLFDRLNSGSNMAHLISKPNSRDILQSNRSSVKKRLTPRERLNMRCKPPIPASSSPSHGKLCLSDVDPNKTPPQDSPRSEYSEHEVNDDQQLSPSFDNSDAFSVVSSMDASTSETEINANKHSDNSPEFSDNNPDIIEAYNALSSNFTEELSEEQRAEEEPMDWNDLDEDLTRCREDFSQDAVNVRVPLDFPNRPTLNVSKHNTLHIVVDTNIFIHQLVILEKLVGDKSLTTETVLYVPWVVILEIEHLMKNNDQKLKSKARIANSFLLEKLRDPSTNFKTQTPIEKDACDQEFSAQSNDDKILQACLSLNRKGTPVILYTNDKNLLVKVLATNTSLKAFSSKELLSNGLEESLFAINKISEDFKVPTQEERNKTQIAMNDIWVYIAKFTETYSKKFGVELDPKVFDLNEIALNTVDSLTTSKHLKSLVKTATSLEVRMFQCLNSSVNGPHDDKIISFLYCLETAFKDFEVPIGLEFEVPIVPKLRPRVVFNCIKDVKFREVLARALYQMKEMKRALNLCACKITQINS